MAYTRFPRSRRLTRTLRALCAVPPAAVLSGCDWVVMNPAGDVAMQQAHLVTVSTLLMLLIIVPVMGLTVWFAWAYRAASTTAVYQPEWDHSTKLELVIWSAPLAIIIALGSITWLATHLLDPYRPLTRLDAQHAFAADARPINVEVVALDWKWLFIYPEQHIASVNELVLPEGRQVRFRITSSTVMNSFYVPALAGQIYAMPGMETRLHAVFNRTGSFSGLSANFSGPGFSHMHFAARSVTASGFDAWVAGARQSGASLDRATYLALDRPSEHVPVVHYAQVAPDLFDAVVNMCVRPGKLCAGEMAMIDARGGTGRAGLLNVAALTYDKTGHEQVVAASSTLADARLHRFVRDWCGANRTLRAAIAGDVVTSFNAAPAAHPVS